jgi:NAD(P)-dependent dehydrogenase (short-subunit alcohol dehydrogenase family)
LENIMSSRLNGKVAIVTGGGTGIGEAICRRFGREGASVIVSGLQGDPLDDVVTAIAGDGGKASAFAGDLSHEDAARGCVAAALREYGKLDILVNNAGILLVNAEADVFPIEQFDEHMRCNVRSAFLMTHFALPHLRKTRGNVIFAGSEGGINGQPRNAVYGGTKGFLHSFMLGVAVEQAQYGVRANCVCPGPVDTAWTHKETGAVDENVEKALIGATPLGRRGTVEEIANVYLFLASDEASFVTGALWLVDGGITPAKGAVGVLANREASTPPALHMNLRHTQDGLKHKDVVKLN